MMNVLIIEDDTWLADSYAKILEKAGFEVRVVQYAEAAMGMIDTWAVDVVLADMMLDTNTVLPLLHELQTYEDTRHLPVVVCTALDSPGIDEKTLHGYGVVAVLNKATMTPEQLVLTLKGVVS